MCTVTLAYDRNNEQATRQLAALLATGLFTELFQDDEFPDLDDCVNDPDMLTRPECVTFDKRESKLIEDAHNMATEEIERLRQKEDITIEESQMLLLRMVEEEYQKP